MVIPYLPGRITRVANEFDARLAAREANAFAQMGRAHSRVMDQLAKDLQNVTAMIADRQARGLPTPVSWLHREHRYASLLLQSKALFDDYAGNVASILSNAQAAAITLAMQHAEAALEAALPNAQSILGSFNSLPEKSVERLQGALSPGSPLDDILQSFGTDAASDIASTLTSGLVKGLHPDTIARQIIDKTSISDVRARTITRTEMYRSYREANRGTYQANSHIVKTWTWFAHLGTHTCAACLAMHGTKHPLDEPMGSHPNCRCTMLPDTKSWAELGFPGLDEMSPSPSIGNAEDFLRNADEATQKAAFGNGKLWRGWKDGDLSLADTVRRVDHPEWGTTRTISGYDAALRRATARKEAERQAREAAEKIAAKAKPKRSRKAVESAEWHATPRTLIDKGIRDEADVRKIGKAVREEAQKKHAAIAKKKTATIEKKITAREQEIADLTKQYNDALRTIPDQLQRAQFRGEIKRKLYTAENDVKALRASLVETGFPSNEALLKTLGEIRPGYGKSTSKLVFRNTNRSAAETRNLLKGQAKNFPSEWWDDFAQKRVTAARVQRGYFKGGTSNVEIMISGRGDDAVGTAIHELTHYAEHMRPRIRQLEKEFYDRRTRGYSLENLSWDTKGEEQKTRKDQFLHEYMGKDYGNTSSSYFELATMGVEALFSPTRAIDLSKDLDYADFILGLLAGV